MRIETDKSVRVATELPGNTCDVAVLHNAYMKKDFIGKGFGASENMLAVKELRNHFFRYVLCTVNMTNVPQIKIMERNGWSLHAQWMGAFDEEVGLFGRYTEVVE